MKLNEIYNSNRTVFAALLIVVVTCYVVVFKAPFVFDDSQFIIQNIHIHTLDVNSIYSGCLTDGAFTGNDCNFYRPNQALVHAVIYHFFKLNPSAYHVVSILFHFFNAFFIFLFLVRLDFSRLASFISALIFAIHPMQTEAVSYISGLCDPLALFFILAGLLVFMKIPGSSGWKSWMLLFISLLMYALAVLSKETAVVMMALPVLLVLCRKVKGFALKPIWIASLAGFVGMAAVYLVAKFTIFNFTGNIGLTAEKNIYTEHLYVRLFTFISILPEYFKIIFFPFTLFIERPYKAYAPASIWAGDRETINHFIVGAILILIIILGLYRSWKRKRIFLLGAAWFFICIAPVSGIIPVNAIYLEHWLYIPSVGLLILLASVTAVFQKGKNFKAYIIVLTIFGSFFLSRCIARNIQWSDAVKFYTNEIKHNTNTARTFNNLAMEYADRKMFSQAIENYQQAIKLNDVYPQTHFNLGRVYEDQKRLNEAVQEFYIAAYMSPAFAYSYQKLGEIYRHTGKIEKANIFDDFLNRTINKGKPVTKEEIEMVYKMK